MSNYLLLKVLGNLSFRTLLKYASNKFQMTRRKLVFIIFCAVNYVNRNGGGGSADRYGSSQSNVEFIHPKLREEMPDNGEGGDPENPWVWLTSYSRIPVILNYNSNLIIFLT